jgi:hypothetical protein
VASRDDEAAFEAAVDAEFQAACEACEAVRRRNEEQLKRPPDERTFFIVPPYPDRARIRERLLRERREAQEKELFELQLAEARRRHASAEQETAAGTAEDDLVGGHPYLKADYETAGKLHHRRKMTVDGIEKRRSLSTRRAYRIYRQFREGVVVYDGITVRPGSGFCWDPVELDNDPPQYKLIRC